MHSSTSANSSTTSPLIYRRPTLLLPSDPYGEPEPELPPALIQVLIIAGQAIHEPVESEGE